MGKDSLQSGGGDPKPPASVKDLGFIPQPMVSWFSPIELINAGIKAALSMVFGIYADKREVQAALAKNEPKDYSDRKELWIDYVADLGDGWDATYSIARLIAEEKLILPAGKDSYTTQRGDILIMGGDQVYPTSNLEEYNNRLIGPYHCALPCVENNAPHLYAVPGNHDWYDGLATFIRLFGQKRWIGGWQTRQERSYFALKLPHGWWLWGIDIQLHADFDYPQLDFFKSVAEQMDAGSKVILCSAEPSWVYHEIKGKAAYKNFDFLTRRLLLPFGHEAVVAIAGDLHNYTRYKHEGGRQQRFISGGGGAYLYSTHNMPEELEIPNKDIIEKYQRESVYPPVKKSKRLALRSIFFPFMNMGFAAFLGIYYLFFAWCLQSESKNSVSFLSNPLNVVDGKVLNSSLLEQFSAVSLLSREGWPVILKGFGTVLAHSPSNIALLLLIFLGWAFFADAKSLLSRVLQATVHTVLHVILLLALMWTAARWNLHVLGLHLDSVPQVILFSIESVLAGGFLGGMIVGTFLCLNNLWFGTYTDEVLLCQKIPDYKNFLRLHINQQGKLTVYPVGIAKVPRKRNWNPFANSIKNRLRAWVLKSQAKKGEPWLEPAKGKIEDYAELIETPVEVD